MHIGRAIREVFDDLPKRCTVQWFADRLCCDKRNIYRIFEKENIDILLLMQISVILEHNFFKDLSEEQEKLLNKKIAQIRK